MSILLTIVYVVIGIIVLVLILGFLMRRTHYVKREIIVEAPQGKVFDYIKLLSNQDNWNKWSMTDPDRNTEFKGTDGTVGFIISWSGNKGAGEGEKEIVNIEDGKSMESQIRFIKPMATTAIVVLDTESLNANRTKLTMSNAGALKYPMNIFIPLVEKKFPKDMDGSLLTLKNILEQ